MGAFLKPTKTSQSSGGTSQKPNRGPRLPQNYPTPPKIPSKPSRPALGTRSPVLASFSPPCPHPPCTKTPPPAPPRGSTYGTSSPPPTPPPTSCLLPPCRPPLDAVLNSLLIKLVRWLKMSSKMTMLTKTAKIKISAATLELKFEFHLQ